MKFEFKISLRDAQKAQEIMNDSPTLRKRLNAIATDTYRTDNDEAADEFYHTLLGDGVEFTSNFDGEALAGNGAQTSSLPFEARFHQFIKGLQALSDKTEVAIHATGAVIDDETPSFYSNDWTSGDIVKGQYKTRASKDAPKGYYKFIDGLEDLSNKWGVWIAVGHPSFGSEKVIYDRDATSGDINYKVVAGKGTKTSGKTPEQWAAAFREVYADSHASLRNITKAEIAEQLVDTHEMDPAKANALASEILPFLNGTHRRKLQLTPLAEQFEEVMFDLGSMGDGGDPLWRLKPEGVAEMLVDIEGMPKIKANLIAHDLLPLIFLQRVERYMKNFPDNATSWRDAGDNMRDLARVVRQIGYNELTLDFLEDNPRANPGLDFRKLKTPAEWNRESKAFIRDLWPQLSAQGQRYVVEYVDQQLAANPQFAGKGAKAGTEPDDKVSSAIDEYKNYISAYFGHQKRYYERNGDAAMVEVMEKDRKDHEYVLQLMRDSDWKGALDEWRRMDTASRDNITDAAYNLLMLKNGVPGFSGKGAKAGKGALIKFTNSSSAWFIRSSKTIGRNLDGSPMLKKHFVIFVNSPKSLMGEQVAKASAITKLSAEAFSMVTGQKDDPRLIYDFLISNTEPLTANDVNSISEDEEVYVVSQDGGISFPIDEDDNDMAGAGDRVEREAARKHALGEREKENKKRLGQIGTATRDIIGKDLPTSFTGRVVKVEGDALTLENEDGKSQTFFAKDITFAAGRGLSVNFDHGSERYYLRVGNIINEMLAGTPSYRYEIMGFRRDGDGQIAARVREKTTTKGRPEVTFTIPLSEIRAKMGDEYVIQEVFSREIADAPFSKDAPRDKALLAAECEIIEMQIVCEEVKKQLQKDAEDWAKASDRAEAQIEALQLENSILEETNARLQDEADKVVANAGELKADMDATLAAALPADGADDDDAEALVGSITFGEVRKSAGQQYTNAFIERVFDAVPGGIATFRVKDISFDEIRSWGGDQYDDATIDAIVNAYPRGLAGILKDAKLRGGWESPEEETDAMMNKAREMAAKVDESKITVDIDDPEHIVEIMYGLVRVIDDLGSAGMGTFIAGAATGAAAVALAKTGLGQRTIAKAKSKLAGKGKKVPAPKIIESYKASVEKYYNDGIASFKGQSDMIKMFESDRADHLSIISWMESGDLAQAARELGLMDTEARHAISPAALEFLRANTELGADPRFGVPFRKQKLAGKGKKVPLYIVTYNGGTKKEGFTNAAAADKFLAQATREWKKVGDPKDPKPTLKTTTHKTTSVPRRHGKGGMFLSSAEYSKIRKTDKAKSYQWDSDTQLYKKVASTTPPRRHGKGGMFLSSAEYSKIRKTDKAKSYQWDSDTQLYKKVASTTPPRRPGRARWLVEDKDGKRHIVESVMRPRKHQTKTDVETEKAITIAKTIGRHKE